MSIIIQFARSSLNSAFKSTWLCPNSRIWICSSVLLSGLIYPYFRFSDWTGGAEPR